jgi:diadenosine tetraphosphatase ApaH/serine/threonine PP2A family protein phosphatase
MKYGVLGDIHGNLSALSSALEHLQGLGAERFVALGDVVGYGAAPGACIDLLREVGAVVVKGNHDAAVAGELDPARFNPLAREAVLWTRAALGTEHLDWLAALPYRLDLPDCSLAHGTYADPERFDYVHGPADADASLEALPHTVGFVGHTHVPIALLRMGDDPHRTGQARADHVDLNGVHRVLINVGSVGQPRDRDVRAACALYDAEGGWVQLERLEYDVDREADRILRAGLPARLGERLRRGA